MTSWLSIRRLIAKANTSVSLPWYRGSSPLICAGVDISASEIFSWLRSDSTDGSDLLVAAWDEDLFAFSSTSDAASLSGMSTVPAIKSAADWNISPPSSWTFCGSGAGVFVLFDQSQKIGCVCPDQSQKISCRVMRRDEQPTFYLNRETQTNGWPRFF